MSFAALLDRRIGVASAEDTTPATRDAHGVAVRIPSPRIVNIPAARQLDDATEDTRARDEQARTFRYAVALENVAGVEIRLDARGWLYDVDADGNEETFEIVGEPELATRRGRPHHWEARARKVDG